MVSLQNGKQQKDHLRSPNTIVSALKRNMPEPISVEKFKEKAISKKFIREGNSTMIIESANRKLLSHRGENHVGTSGMQLGSPNASQFSSLNDGIVNDQVVMGDKYKQNSTLPLEDAKHHYQSSERQKASYQNNDHIEILGYQSNEISQHSELIQGFKLQTPRQAWLSATQCEANGFPKHSSKRRVFSQLNSNSQQVVGDSEPAELIDQPDTSQSSSNKIKSKLLIHTTTPTDRSSVKRYQVSPQIEIEQLEETGTVIHIIEESPVNKSNPTQKSSVITLEGISSEIVRQKLDLQNQERIKPNTSSITYRRQINKNSPQSKIELVRRVNQKLKNGYKNTLDMDGNHQCSLKPSYPDILLQNQPQSMIGMRELRASHNATTTAGASSGLKYGKVPLSTHNGPLSTSFLNKTQSPASFFSMSARRSLPNVQNWQQPELSPTSTQGFKIVIQAQDQTKNEDEDLKFRYGPLTPRVNTEPPLMKQKLKLISKELDQAEIQILDSKMKAQKSSNIISDSAHESSKLFECYAQALLQVGSQLNNPAKLLIQRCVTGMKSSNEFMKDNCLKFDAHFKQLSGGFKSRLNQLTKELIKTQNFSISVIHMKKVQSELFDEKNFDIKVYLQRHKNQETPQKRSFELLKELGDLVSGNFSTLDSADRLFHIPASSYKESPNQETMGEILKYTVLKLEECEQSVESPEVRQSIKADLLQYLKASGAYEQLEKISESIFQVRTLKYSTPSKSEAQHPLDGFMTDLLENQNMAEKYYKTLLQEMKAVINDNSMDALKMFIKRNAYRFKEGSFGRVQLLLINIIKKINQTLRCKLKMDQPQLQVSIYIFGTLLLKYLEAVDDLKESKIEVANIKKYNFMIFSQRIIILT